MPGVRLHLILGHALALVVADSQIGLSCSVILVGGLAIPLRHFLVIRHRASAVVVAVAQIVLSRGVTLLGLGLVFQELFAEWLALLAVGAGREQAGGTQECSSEASDKEFVLHAFAFRVLLPIFAMNRLAAAAAGHTPLAHRMARLGLGGIVLPSV